MADALQRIRALIALSSSTNEHEARNAALLAVQLIQRHHVELVLPAVGWGTSFPSPVEVMNAQEAFRSVPKKTASQKKPSSPPPGWKLIKAKYNGLCKWCGKRIAKDARMYWSKVEGGAAYHPTCFELSNS